MILVDTSVLIDFFKGNYSSKTELLRNIIARKIPYGICSLVYMELLQGAKNQKEYEILKEYLSTQVFYELKHEHISYEAAARNYLKCRQNGITVASTIDMVIAQIAIENNLALLHDDSDYSHMAEIITELIEYNP